MKIFGIILFISLSAFGKSKEDKIVQLLDLMGTEKNLGVMKTQFSNILKQASPTAPDPVLDSLLIRLNKKGLYKIVIPIYSKNFDEETIEAVTKFYKTKAGQEVISKMPLILQESMQAGAVWGQNLMMEIINELKTKGYEVKEI